MFLDWEKFEEFTTQKEMIKDALKQEEEQTKREDIKYRKQRMSDVCLKAKYN